MLARQVGMVRSSGACKATPKNPRNPREAALRPHPELMQMDPDRRTSRLIRIREPTWHQALNNSTFECVSPPVVFGNDLSSGCKGK